MFLQGGIFVSKKLKRSFESNNEHEEGEKNIFNHLSLTELKVLGYILKGHRTKEIASEMDVTQQTIATFKSRIFKKLGTENIFQIQRLAELNNINFS